MNKYARTALAKSTKILSSSRPFSNFDLVEDRFGGLRQLRHILSQARMLGGKTMVIETLASPKDLQEENEDIRKLCPKFQPKTSEFVRVSFFSLSYSQFRLDYIPKNAFLGYAIYKKDLIPPTENVCPEGNDLCRIYESVMKNRRGNNSVRGAPTWNCRVGAQVFRINGYLYAQQNGITNSCAHVAVRTVATRFLGEDLSYRQMNRWIRSFRRSTGRDQGLPGDGLESQEICHLLRKVGINPVVGNYTRREQPPVPYQKYLCGSIESGFPAILFFGTGRSGRSAYHTVSLFGRTFNEDIWVPDAARMYFRIAKATKSLSSSMWVGMFVGHDDNAGSNFCIPQHYVEGKRICRSEKGRKIYCRLQQGSVAYAIGTLPRNILVNAIEAEAIGADCLLPVLKQMPHSDLGSHKRWQIRLADYHKDGQLVLRAVLINGHQYAAHLKMSRGWSSTKKFPLWLAEAIDGHASKDPFWMVELSVPELFSANQRKVGEILIQAKCEASSDRNFKNFYCARIPGWFAFLQDMKKAANGVTVR